MGKLMKFLYSLMLIVLILLGALFLAFGIDGQAVFEAFVYNESVSYTHLTLPTNREV